MRAFYGANEGVYEVYLVDRDGLILAGTWGDWDRMGGMTAAFFSVGSS